MIKKKLILATAEHLTPMEHEVLATDFVLTRYHRNMKIWKTSIKLLKTKEVRTNFGYNGKKKTHVISSQSEVNNNKSPMEPDKKTPNTQPNNPLHGVKLVDILEQLTERYTWEELADRININCFKSNPTIKSSLKFLRRTPWARTKVEQLYLKSFYK